MGNLVCVYAGGVFCVYRQVSPEAMERGGWRGFQMGERESASVSQLCKTPARDADHVGRVGMH